MKDWDKPETERGATVSLLFFLALYGSVNHEVGEVDVAFGFFRLQHTDWTIASVKTNWWLQTTSLPWHLSFKNCNRLLLLFSATKRWWHTVDLVEVIIPVNQTRQLRISLSEPEGPLAAASHSGNAVTLLGGSCSDRLAERQLWQTQVWLISPPPLLLCLTLHLWLNKC